MTPASAAQPAAPAARAGNPARAVRLHKVVVSIGVGESGEKLEKAAKVVQMVTGQKPVKTQARITNKDLGVREGMPIGCKVTLRGTKAAEFLKTALWVKENRVDRYAISKDGNFSFGIADYTDFPGMKYNPDIGIFGMDVTVVLSRLGKRLSLRRRSPRRLPARQRVTREESAGFIVSQLKAEVV